MPMPTLRDILNGTPADATDVEYNFDAIESYMGTGVDDRFDALEPQVYSNAGAITTLGTALTALDTKYESLTVFQRVADTALANGASYHVVWDTETSDPDGWGATGSATLTCPATGLYLIAANIPAGELVSVNDIDTTGTTVVLLKDQATSTIVRTELHYMTAGATVKFEVFAGAATTMTNATIYIARLR